MFFQEQYAPMESHWCRYPLSVDKDGKVDSAPDMEYVPDTKALIKGVASAMPDILTT